MAVVSDPSLVPEGYHAIPLSAAPAYTPIRICVLARAEPESAGGYLVTLRQTLDADVFLGCILDHAGIVHRWVELWVQRTAHTPDLAEIVGGPSTNHQTDRRWAALLRAFGAARGLWQTGWEADHPPPLYLDTHTMQPVHPVHETSGHPWRLCTDDRLLSNLGLPPYGATHYRYLCVPELGSDSPILPATGDAPAAPEGTSLAELADSHPEWVPINPGAGLLLVREYAPIALDIFAAILGGRSWEGLGHGRSVLNLGLSEEALTADPTAAPWEGRLFSDRQGLTSRAVETLCLKLRLFVHALATVQSAVKTLQRPILNLTMDSFTVRTAPRDSSLPILWTADVALADAGTAQAIQIPFSDAKIFVATPEISIFRPVGLGVPLRGRGGFRIRDVQADGGAIIIEGTLTTQEALTPGPNDLVCVPLHAGGTAFQLFGTLVRDDASAADEWRFRSVAHTFDDTQQAELRRASGVLFQDVSFHLLPTLTVAHDLYAMGVLAVHLFLQGGTAPVSHVVDRILSLARHTAGDTEAAQDNLPGKIRRAFEQNAAWQADLGPHLLLMDAPPVEGVELIPPEHWAEFLTAVVELFPESGPEGLDPSYGGLQASALHRAFSPALEAFRRLRRHSTGLAIPDWEQNKEVRLVLDRFDTIGDRMS
jgi:hypothetical protein